MVNIKEDAMAYEPKRTRNISELKEIPIDIEIKNGKGTNKQGEDFEYKYVEVEGIEYRVANVVLEQLKAQITSNPNLAKFKVTKVGETKDNTRYTVVPLV